MITVIIVNYNTGALLTECVQSVLASSLPVKVVVVDNCSTDESVLLLRHLLGEANNLIIIENDINLGFAKANNIALHYAEGEYFLLLNPDCIIHPDTIQQMRDIMDARQDVAVSGCLIRNLDGSEQVGCRRFIPTPWRSLVRVFKLSKLFPHHPGFQDFNLCGTSLPSAPVPVEAISGAFMFVRKSVIEHIGELDDKYFLHCEDLDWCIRFTRAGYNILFVPQVEISHVKGGSSWSRPLFVEWHKHKGMVRFYRKFYRNQYPGVLMGAVFLMVWTRFVAAFAYIMLKNMMPVTARHKVRHSKYYQSVSSNSPRILVVGASSIVGHFLLPRLVNAGYEVHAISRSHRGVSLDTPVSPLQNRRETALTNQPDSLERGSGSGSIAIDKNLDSRFRAEEDLLDAPAGYSSTAGAKVIWHQADISHPEQLPDLNNVEALIHLAPLWLLPPLLPSLDSIKVRRIIAFGSTSLFGKAASADAGERNLVARLAGSEEAICQFCTKSDIHWTIFRPTLTYDCARDKNVTVIARFIRRYGFFPLLGNAVGRRQPVHADDLAAACVNALNQPTTFNRVYNLSGGETLNYRQMIERIFIALGKPPRFTHIPFWFFQWAIRVVSLLPGKRRLAGDMAARMNVDLCYDHSDATRDFGFAPRTFNLEGRWFE